MRSRTIREGSVGLLILLGIGLFGIVALWLRGLQPGKRSYQVNIEFADAAGLDAGNPVQFRGVTVGRVAAIQPGPNGVVVMTEINSVDLLIPRDVIVEASQSGFIGEVSVDLIPGKPLSSAAIAADLQPFEPDCNPNLIVCNGDTLQGRIGVSYDELVRATVRLSEVLSDPVLIGNINRATRNISVAAGSVDQLSKQTQQELANFSETANSVTRAANQLNQVARRSGPTLNQLSHAANRVGSAADQVSNLTQTNRGTLTTTLDNLSQASRELRVTVGRLSPTLNRVSQGELVGNLEVLAANAAQASTNLRDLTTALNSPTNLLVLQQTLDSARVTFQNTQKITTEVDELTGDPEFRKNLRNLVNGLSKLVSSTQDLEQQVQTAEFLAPTPLEQVARENSHNTNN